MTNTDESSQTIERDKGHSVPYLRLLPKAENPKRYIVDEEFYIKLYYRLRAEGIVKDEQDYLYWVFVNQRMLTKTLLRCGCKFVENEDEGGAAE